MLNDRLNQFGPQELTEDEICETIEILLDADDADDENDFDDSINHSDTGNKAIQTQKEIDPSENDGEVQNTSESAETNTESENIFMSTQHDEIVDPKMNQLTTNNSISPQNYLNSNGVNSADDKLQKSTRVRLSSQESNISTCLDSDNQLRTNGEFC